MFLVHIACCVCSEDDRLVILTFNRDLTRRLNQSMEIIDALKRPCAVSDRLERRKSMRAQQSARRSSISSSLGLEPKPSDSTCDSRHVKC